MENSPKLWKSALPVKGAAQHKYCHGLAVVFGAPVLTGGYAVGGGGGGSGWGGVG